MNTLYNFPKTAAFGKMLSKSKIYEHATPTSKVKELFVREVEKIIWAYKLSPDTINIPTSNDVQEIQVFTVRLKTKELSQAVLSTIDKAIPSPILFELRYNEKIKFSISYKRPSEANKNKWVISRYFETPWMSDSTEKVDLPIVLNMTALYHFFLKAIIPLSSRKEEDLNTLVQRVDRVQINEREIKKLDHQIKKEQQFNRCVELNQTRNKLKQDIENLKT